MITPYIWLVAAVAIVIILAAAIVLFVPREKLPQEEATESVITAPESSVVTVRKIGGTTRVDIHTSIHSHWEGDGGVAPKPTPVEVTRREQPELYEEYMSSETTATRKYEIVDELYSMGYTLPLIPSLHEQWVREQALVRAQREDPPKENPAPRRLSVNHDLGAEPLPPLGDTEEEGSPLPPGRIDVILPSDDEEESVPASVDYIEDYQ